MGLDFINKTKKAFHKGLDQARVDLCTPDLFMLNPNQQPRAYAATVRPNTELVVGEHLCVRARGDTVLALRGIDVVAEFCDLPTQTAQAINDSHYEAHGTVQAVYDPAATAEITIC